MKLSEFINQHNLVLQWWRVRHSDHEGQPIVWYGGIRVKEPGWEGVLGFVSCFANGPDDMSEEKRYELLKGLAGLNLDARKDSHILHITPGEPWRTGGADDIRWIKFPDELEIDTLGEDVSDPNQMMA